MVGECFGDVEPCAYGLIIHWSSRLFEGYEQGQVSFLALHVALESRYLVALYISALDLHDDALGLAAVVVEEVDEAVDAGVSSLLAVAGWSCIDQAQRPPLELVAVVECE